MKLIAVPAVITLAITILRLVGELRDWSPTFFSREAGGGFAIVGISWLVPVLGIYFAIKLSNAGQGPTSVWRPIVFPLLGVVVIVLGAMVGIVMKDQFHPVAIVALCLGAIAGTGLQLKPWPSLAKALLAYGFAARIPVTIIMFLAIRGNWSTHYDAPPPEFPADMGWLPKFFAIGFLPQLVFVWIPFTVIIGMLIGGIAVAIAHRGKQTAQAQA